MIHPFEKPQESWSGQEGDILVDMQGVTKACHAEIFVQML